MRFDDKGSLSGLLPIAQRTHLFVLVRTLGRTQVGI